MVNIPPVYEMFLDFLCPTARPDGQFDVGKLSPPPIESLLLLLLLLAKI